MAKVVQTLNPVLNRYVKINKDKGKVVATKKTPGPFKGVPIARKRNAKRQKSK